MLIMTEIDGSMVCIVLLSISNITGVGKSNLLKVKKLKMFFINNHWLWFSIIREI